MKLLPGEWEGFAYAVQLAQDRGAHRVLVQPRLFDEDAGEVRPDIFAEMSGRRPLIVEVEDSSGAKFAEDGPRDRESRLRGKADFVFLIGRRARGRCERRLRQLFGEDAEIVYLADLQQRYGRLGIAVAKLEPDSAPSLPNPPLQRTAPARRR